MTVTWLLYNLSGQLTGLQEFKPYGEPRYKSHGTGLWGLQHLNPSDRVLYVVEGVRDTHRFLELGLNCVALLGCGRVDKYYNQLHSMGYFVVPVCDNDKPGMKLKRLGKLHFVAETDPADYTTQQVVELDKTVRNHLLNS